ncbi:MAG: hypothetical protein AAFP97_05835 [Pseudomonadota bacterium]
MIDQIIHPDLPQTLNVGLTAYANYGSVAQIYPDFHSYNTQGTPENEADLIASVDRFDIRKPLTGRLLIANIDAPAINAAIVQRRDDLYSD